MGFESDTELVAALLRRKDDAWSNFLTIHRKLIFGIIKRRAHAEAEEYEEIYSQVIEKICQEEFKVLRHWNGQGRLKAYLAVVISNFIRDLNRIRSKRPSHMSLDDPDMPEIESSETLEGGEQKRRAIECYRKCVAELTEKQRGVLKLRAAGYSRREIGAKLNITENYVGVRLSEIRTRLRGLLLARCPELVAILFGHDFSRSSED
jgi:RNA polymerase sigma factor (sigma-70 family)